MSFNVKCAFTNIVIEENDEVIFYPLNKSNSKVKSSINLLNKTVDYIPLSFILKGRYNGYGGLKEIKEDSSLTILKEKMQLNGEDFIELINKNESINKEGSILYNSYTKHKSKDLKELFILLGFSENNNIYKHELNELIDYSFFLNEDVENDLYEFIIYIKDVELKSIKKPKKIAYEMILNEIDSILGYGINVLEEFKYTFNGFNNNFTGMFILKEVFDDFILNKYKINENDLNDILDSFNKLNNLLQNLYDINLSHKDIESFIKNTNVLEPFNHYLFISHYLIDIIKYEDLIVDALKIEHFMYDYSFSFKPSYTGCEFIEKNDLISFNEFKYNLIKKR